MKISIITVCFNAMETIEETILSVLGQTYKDIEYIIIDGQSNDNTMDIIRRYLIQENIYVVSEKDEGIYDAMNKGIGLATGEYLYFLNSGDFFCDNYVVERVVNKLKIKNSDIVYGDIYNVYKNHKEHISYKDINLSANRFIRGTSICHQAIFAKKEVFDNNTFDINYKICSDKNWIINSYLNKFEFNYINLDICLFDKSGISCEEGNRQIVQEETKRILRNSFPIWYRVINIIRRVKNGKKDRNIYTNI